MVFSLSDNTITHLPQALLLATPNKVDAIQLTHTVISQVLCEKPPNICHNCASCKLTKKNAHPDVSYIQPEKSGGTIKIDQIREIQANIYQTPQCAAKRIVLLAPADNLNHAAANALLKILEEPPRHVHFILVATHLNRLPQTILSRCTKYFLPEASCPLEQTEAQVALNHSQEKLTQSLLSAMSQNTSACQITNEYKDYMLDDLLNFFQLFTIQLIKQSLMPEQTLRSDAFKVLATRHTPMHHFKQLDMISNFIKQTHKNIPLNTTLLLEALIIGYLC